MTNKLLRGVLAAVIASAAAAGSVISVSAYGLERHSQAEIKQMYQKLYFDTHDVPEYTEPFSTDSPGYEGRISDDTLDEGLNSINFCRYLAGLPYDIELDNDYNVSAQKASLIIFMNKDKPLTHQPSQPAGMGDDLYADAYKASGESNIGKGYISIQASIVQGYMSDTDEMNLSMLGHRRWILNPDMQKTGLGIVGDGSAVGTAMYVKDKSRADKFTGDYLYWPPALMPNEMVSDNDSGYAYSVNLNSCYDKPDRDKVVIKLTSKLLGKTFTFDNNSSKDPMQPVGYFDVSQSFIGFGNCLIFNPGPLPENDVVEVEISGIYKNGVEEPIKYKVNYFDMLDDSDYTLGFEQDSYEIEIGQSMLIKGYDHPLGGDELRMWYYPSNKEYLEYLDVTESGGSVYVTGKKEGTVSVYLGNSQTWYDDKVTNVTVTHKHDRDEWVVEKEPTNSEAGSRYRVCKLCGKVVDREVLPAKSVAMTDVILGEDSYTYTGSEIEPKVKVYAGEKRLVQGTDYEISFRDNIELGKGTVIIKGIGYFGGEKQVNFPIVKRDPVSLEKLDITFNGDNVIFTGSDIEPKLTIREGTYKLVKDKDYSIEYSNNHDAGKGKVTVTGLGDYVGTVSYTFDIVAADIGDPWVESDLPDVKYSGKPVILDLELESQVTGEELFENIDYTVTYENNDKVGTATVTVTGMGNYSGTSTNTFRIVDGDGTSVIDGPVPPDTDDKDEQKAGPSDGKARSTGITVNGADKDNTAVIFVDSAGKTYKSEDVEGSTFYADLPAGEYLAWILKDSCAPESVDVTVGDVLSTVDVTVYSYGDINRDGQINVTDTSMSAAFTKAKRAPADEQQRLLADVNLDNMLNVTDTSKIAAHSKGIKVLAVETDFEIPTSSDTEKPADEKNGDAAVTDSDEQTDETPADSSDTTEKTIESEYERVKAEYLEEFNTEWGEAAAGMAGYSTIDIDSDGTDELIILGSIIHDAPYRLYAYKNGEAVLLKETDSSAGEYIVLTSHDGELYVTRTDEGKTYYDIYIYSEGELTLAEKAVFAPLAADDEDFGEYERISEDRVSDLEAYMILFD